MLGGNGAMRTETRFWPEEGNVRTRGLCILIEWRKVGFFVVVVENIDFFFFFVNSTCS